MANDSAASPAHLQKFQKLLRELFQFDCADLDFGIYRIMNHKRDAIERFISEELPERIADELNIGHIARQSQATERLKAVRAELETALGKEAIDADGELDAKYSTAPIGESYLEAKAAVESGRGLQDVEAEIYNHLYTFFRRYYQDGDFISRRRYSRTERYAIPYNGEEVYLHWANNDQYYVKTAEYFHNYAWTAPSGVSVRFRLEAANVEQNNVKGDQRFFVPLVEKTDWDPSARAVTVPFEYRPLTEEEGARYRNQKKQDKIIADAVDEVPRQVRKEPAAFEALTGEHRRSENGGSVSRLEHHLRQYTRRNDSDFFIHKDLRGFLSRELDFYLKNEVLNLDNLAAAGEQVADGWFQQMRLIKSIGSEIIEFLAQIEDFQKMLWEKRKFVVDCQYCITLGSLASDFYPEIVENEAQWKEWQELLGIDGTNRSVSFLEEHPTLPLDTHHFDTEFTDRLLASFDDLDGMTDGLLVHSENWQALRMMDEMYRERVKCIYIDPPYNTFATKILYKNGYEHSSWMSLLHDRLLVSNALLQHDGMICSTVDDYEFSRLKFLMERAFGIENHVATVAIRNNPSGRSTVRGVAINHEYGLFFAKSSDGVTVGRMPHTRDQRDRYKETDEDGRRFEWENFRKSSAGSFRSDRPKQFFPIYFDTRTSTLRIPCMNWTESTHTWDILEDVTEYEIAILPIDRQGRERVWRYGVDRTRATLKEARVSKQSTGGHQIYTKKYFQTKGSLPRTWWDKSEYSARDNGTRTIVELFGSTDVFDFPKATAAIMDSVRVCLPGNDGTVLDYFAGSGTTGHAVINLNREDGGQRKFILVEMGDHFDSVLLPRIKKMTYSSEWKNGSPKHTATPEEVERSPRIIKYMRMESYEDALDGIGFDEDAGRLNLEGSIDGYLLKYMLRWETKRSETLLNAAMLTRPFEYRLRSHAHGKTRERPADVAETFNYLLGLNVRTRQVYHDDARRYLVYRGETRESPECEVVVIWREAEGWVQEDFARDREFVREMGFGDGVDTLYVNGNSCIPGAKAIDPLFKARMFSGVSG